ncbi:hypothetical protein SAMN05421863_109314 [Nitrosomonas communis]|uniref:Uncharacterized protein n=2 Tax=Nitrosomonas communis TaxID=44574 RepID=A0A1I4VYF6_9PROT|nr:hypothetical protein SAMN05421863_109314 [Nitrosomonas communis]
MFMLKIVSTIMEKRMMVIIIVECTKVIIIVVCMGDDHGHKLDATTLKQFFEPLPDAIIHEKKMQL